LTKIWSKWTSKNVKSRGVKIIKNHQFSISGTRTPHFINFLKVCTFLQKRSRFRPPKSTPKVGLLKNAFPTKTPVLLLQWGSENVTFWGSGGRTGFCKKCRHYYIAKIDFSALLDPHNFDHFDPAEWKFDFNLSRPNLSVENLALKYRPKSMLKYY
jgi:hypothetical protein